MVYLKLLLTAFGSWLLAFVLPSAAFLIFTTVLVFADLLTGTMAAKHRGEIIHSRGLRRSIVKIVLYFTAILLSEGFETVFVLGIDISYMVAGLIAVTEFKSNLENIGQVTGIDIWSKIAEKLPSLTDILPNKKDKDA
jgi:phage-related holin